MTQVTAIVLAAGQGKRFRSTIPKPLVKVCSQPIIIFSLKILSQHPSVKGVIVVVNPENKKGILAAIQKYHIKKITKVVEGGLLRQDSVYNALQCLPQETDVVLIHDGARPFLQKAWVTNVIQLAAQQGAAIVGMPVKATIKKVAQRATRQTASRFLVQKTLDRSQLWEIQTPQAFKKDIIVKAYARYGNISVTDDAALVERMGKRVHVIESSYSNIKITTPEDLILAEAIVRKYC
ncbi:MAG: 2-C-methyl-D-erythritol 4-phosphate cytidylyltransferase [Candidatus Omnitrophica bacterium]|nr:2-C-methyl-D-erythritol 4-phosphate cytidylyltransferase [Candidatus Omnitrophota bacterium]